MRKKAVKAMLGLCMAVTVISSSVPCFAEDAAQAETQMDESETVPEETVEESESDFIEGSALLSDYGYEKGTITEAGWMSSFLNMQYVPKDGITMAITRTRSFQNTTVEMAKIKKLLTAKWLPWTKMVDTFRCLLR